MSFIPNLTYSIASTVWSAGTSAALGKGQGGKGPSSTTTVAGPAQAEGTKKNGSKENGPKVPTTPEERYRVVDDILETENLYRVLAVNHNATSEEIRRAYIAKSRVCHPDKFPEYPRATEAFQ
ncbi:hypothetical protein BGZ46_005785, partial [Entomortierella lignicola]